MEERHHNVFHLGSYFHIQIKCHSGHYSVRFDVSTLLELFPLLRRHSSCAYKEALYTFCIISKLSVLIYITVGVKTICHGKQKRRCFQIHANGQHLAHFHHREDPHHVTALCIRGDVRVQKIHFEHFAGMNGVQMGGATQAPAQAIIIAPRPAPLVEVIMPPRRPIIEVVVAPRRPGHHHHRHH
ncbi:unnamed protein product [Heligmosomoides polygyrus]|uniref:Galectin n=1 Tax=Heligmosomoides polygyrus TaxID=6339 RepID=A0A183G3L2_HELPZ|nr:unnamed protein product [Heligmosomoides polygyrus]